MSTTNVRCTCTEQLTAGRAWCPVHDEFAGAPEMPEDMEFVFDPGIQFYPEPPRPLTIRDHFAMAAIVGLIANPSWAEAWDTHAATAYKVADAMLETREKS